MIADDMVVIQEILKEILNLKGHQVIYVAENGQEVIDYFLNPNNDCPDIIIMDQRMPMIDGLTATREVLALENTVKIIFISADAGVKEGAIATGVADFLIKPIELKTMLNTIEKLTC